MSDQKRLTCRDEEGRARLMPGANLVDVIETLCRIEERGQGVLIMPRDEKQVKIDALLQNLEEDTDWAEANIWEVPIALLDHLIAARDIIKALLLRQRLAPEQVIICRAAIDKYGRKAQTMMVFEEMAELQKELCKHARGADNKAHIAEEIADVLIMLEQMILAHDCAGMVRIQIASKLHRLDKRLKE